MLQMNCVTENWGTVLSACPADKQSRPSCAPRLNLPVGSKQPKPSAATWRATPCRVGLGAFAFIFLLPRSVCRVCFYAAAFAFRLEQLNHS
jgi:hypothetical protein